MENNENKGTMTLKDGYKRLLERSKKYTDDKIEEAMANAGGGLYMHQISMNGSNSAILNFILVCDKAEKFTKSKDVTDKLIEMGFTSSDNCLLCANPVTLSGSNNVTLSKGDASLFYVNNGYYKVYNGLKSSQSYFSPQGVFNDAVVPL